jgi:hypothetical protein
MARRASSSSPRVYLAVDLFGGGVDEVHYLAAMGFNECPIDIVFRNNSHCALPLTKGLALKKRKRARA